MSPWSRRSHWRALSERETRRGRRVRPLRPGLEALEGRQLLSLSVDFAVPVGVVGTGSVDVESNAVTNDAAGNVYVTGSLQGTADFDPGPGVVNLSSAGSRDVFVAKYSPAGALVWAKTLRAVDAQSVAQGASVAVDAAGNVTIGGTFTGGLDVDSGSGAASLSADGRNDGFIARLGNDGKVLWVRAIVANPGTMTQTYALAVDGAGGLVATGSFQGAATFGTTRLTAGGSVESFVTRLDASGQFLWAKATAGAGVSVAQSTGIAFDPSGNLVESGFFAGTVDLDPGPATRNATSAGSRDIYVRKFDASGNLSWAVTLGGDDIDQANSVASDASGNVYVTGMFSNAVDFDPGPGQTTLTSGGFMNPFLLKLGGDGTFRWARALRIEGFLAGQGTGVGVDASGRVFLAGYYQGVMAIDSGTSGTSLASAGGFDVFIAGYESDGRLVGGATYGGPNFDAEFGIGVNPSGQVALAGRYSGPSTFGNVTLPAMPNKSIFIAQIRTASVVEPPPAPAITLQAASDTGLSSSDRITRATTLGFDVTGVSAAGNLVELLRNGVVVATRWGNGTITDTGPVPDGTHTYTVRQTDAHGAVSPVSSGVAVTVDTQAPATPAAPTLLPADDTGVVGDGRTSKRTPRLIGFIEPLARLELLDAAGNVRATATAGSDGAYSVLASSTPLADGSYSWRVRAIDAAGNVSGLSAATVVVIDGTPPAAPAAPTLLPADDTGTLGDGRTALRRPRLAGVTEAGATVQLLNAAGDVIGTVTAGGDGAYQVAPATDLPDGLHSLRVRAIDAAGNVSAASNPLTITIDGTPPAAPGVPTLHPDDDTGTIGDGVTTVRQPRLSGNAEAGATVELIDASGNVLGSGTASATGSYTIAIATPLPLGTNAIRARARDAAGNLGNPGPALSLTIVAPVVVPATPTTPILLAADDSGTIGDGLTRVRQPRFTGTSAVGTTVQLIDAAGSVLGSAATLADGSYVVTIGTPLADGSYAIRARARDAAGNLSAASAAFTLAIDATAPAAPSAPQLLPADDTGTVGDGATSRTQPRLVGTAEPGSTVRLVDPMGNVLGSGTATVGGAYTITLANPLPLGTTLLLRATATDAAGNASAASAAFTLTIRADTLPRPSAPSLLPADDTGVSGDRKTTVRRPRLTGNAVAGATVELLDAGGQVLGSAVAAAGTGAYVVQPASNLPLGASSLTIRVRDASGAVSEPSPELTLSIITVAAGDFDGDGQSDFAVFRPSTQQWFARYSSGLGTLNRSFGGPGLMDIPVTADFDGDGKADLAVFRASTAQWFVLGPNGGYLLGTFGATDLFDIPVPGDYDGDGKAEMAVFRPSTAQWFAMGPTGGRLLGTFGATNLADIPVPGDYDGDGVADLAVFRPSTAQWFFRGPTGSVLLGSFGATNLSDIPVPGDYDGDGKAEPAVFRPSTAQWFARGAAGGRLLGAYGGGQYLDIPAQTSTGALKRLGVLGTARTASQHVAAAPVGAAILAIPTPQVSGPAEADDDRRRRTSS